MRALTNQREPDGFLTTALRIRGSVSPRVLPRVIVAVVFSVLVVCAAGDPPVFHVPITPFEYSGVVLSLVLVLRVNAGLDRWWEARKAWGSIVNQSRNLALIVAGYGGETPARGEFLRWVAAWPHVIRESLRQQTGLADAERLVGTDAAWAIRGAVHMPTFVASRIVAQLRMLRRSGLDDFAFLRAESERSFVIDAVGACERIRDTPMPLALAIKTRRFLLLFLLLLPFALVERAGWLTPLVVSLASYPLFCLDEIGMQLQRPFSVECLSHLPLETIGQSIERSVLSLDVAPTVLVDPITPPAASHTPPRGESDRDPLAVPNG